MRLSRVLSNLRLQWSFFILLISHFFLLWIALHFAFELRYEFKIPQNSLKAYKIALYSIIPFQIFILYLLRQFHTSLSYFRYPDFIVNASGLGAASACCWIFAHLYHQAFPIPKSVLILDFILSLSLVILFRFFLRLLKENYFQSLTKIPKGQSNIRRAIIFGASDTGALVAANFLNKRNLKTRPIAFLDDDPIKRGKNIHNVPILGTLEQLEKIKREKRADLLICTLPYSAIRRTKEAIELAQSLGLKTQILNPLKEWESGQSTPIVRDIEFEDLLDRKPIALDLKLLRSEFEDKTVLVTGAGGSIGSEICRQIAALGCRQLLLLDFSEFSLFQIEQELIDEGHRSLIIPLVKDIRNFKELEKVFAQFHPQIIMHAAAYKHVPMMEIHAGEAVLNNTFGTLNLALLAKKYFTEKMTLISTDKAINPTNIMGASKRLAEITLQNLQQTPDNKTQFLAVRFGNVLGSSGSVLNTFKKQIAKGGPVTVTHPKIERYFMTISEAVSLVLQTISKNTQGGEIFVLDMGTPLKILDIAHKMIQLSGFVPNVDIAITFTGLRPGEKLFEEIQCHNEFHSPSHQAGVFLFKAKNLSWDDPLKTIFEQLRQVSEAGNPSQVKQFVAKILPEYTPSL